MVFSFCGKAQDEVANLIAGPSEVAICEDCVRLCIRILDTQDATLQDVRGWLPREV